MEKSPLPLLAALAIGAGLLIYGSNKKQNPIEGEDEIPTSIDYEDENLKDALESLEEDDE